jgi:uncharacterized protein (DUF427 family)
MSLMMGTGPFGHTPAGVFNIDRQRRDVLFFDPFPRRVRGLLDGETIVDSHHTTLLHEHGQLPRCYFPEADVRTNLLEPSSHQFLAGEGPGGLLDVACRWPNH